MSNETIYLKGPFGTGIRYKGRTPFLSMLKLGSACLILGVAGISLYKYKKKIDIDEEIRKDKAVTQNKIDFDNVHTENNRQKKNTRGEIKKDVLLRQTREYSLVCLRSTSFLISPLVFFFCLLFSVWTLSKSILFWVTALSLRISSSISIFFLYL